MCLICLYDYLNCVIFQLRGAVKLSEAGTVFLLILFAAYLNLLVPHLLVRLLGRQINS